MGLWLTDSEITNLHANEQAVALHNADRQTVADWILYGKAKPNLAQLATTYDKATVANWIRQYVSDIDRGTVAGDVDITKCKERLSKPASVIAIEAAKTDLKEKEKNI